MLKRLLLVLVLVGAVVAWSRPASAGAGSIKAFGGFAGNANCPSADARNWMGGGAFGIGTDQFLRMELGAYSTSCEEYRLYGAAESFPIRWKRFQFGGGVALDFHPNTNGGDSAGETYVRPYAGIVYNLKYEGTFKHRGRKYPERITSLEAVVGQRKLPGDRTDTFVTVALVLTLQSAK